ncbi:unnamed protein product, partial [Ectocarpus fasciculatus]
MCSRSNWHHLEAAAIAGPVRGGLTGAERSMIFALAIQTGLRSNEIRSLRRSSLHLDSDKLFVVVLAGSSKNRRTARQYVRPELADHLRQHAAMMSPGAGVFEMPAQKRVPKMLQADLNAAREAWLDEI